MQPKFDTGAAENLWRAALWPPLVQYIRYQIIVYQTLNLNKNWTKKNNLRDNFQFKRFTIYKNQFLKVFHFVQNGSTALSDDTATLIMRNVYEMLGKPKDQVSISSTFLRTAFTRTEPKSVKEAVKSSIFLRFWELRA